MWIGDFAGLLLSQLIDRGLLGLHLIMERLYLLLERVYPILQIIAPLLVHLGIILGSYRLLLIRSHLFLEHGYLLLQCLLLLLLLLEAYLLVSACLRLLHQGLRLLFGLLDLVLLPLTPLSELLLREFTSSRIIDQGPMSAQRESCSLQLGGLTDHSLHWSWRRAQRHAFFLQCG